MFKILNVFMLATALIGCQTVQEKNLALIRESADKLKAYASWQPTWCRVEARLTQPAMARYREMLKVDNPGSDVVTYTWKARKNVCEVTPLEPSELAKNHKAFLETALCMLWQVHYVNSPFSELNFSANDVVSANNRVQIRTTPNDVNLGIFLDPQQMYVETRTKSRGVLSAQYVALDGEWLPSKIEQKQDQRLLVLDEIQFGDRRLNGRRLPSSIWISVGDVKTHPHTQLLFSDCQTF